MKKVILSTLAASLISLSTASYAEGPFNYIDFTLGNISYDNSGSGTYSALTTSFETEVVPLVNVKTQDFDGSDSLWLGAGAYTEVGTYSHLYGLLHYVNDDGDNDVSLTTGVRSTVSDRIDLGVEMLVILTDSDQANQYTISAGYYFTEKLSVSGKYITSDGYSILGATLKVGL
ncbi:hypothetical protein OFY17_09975 [Marinomonas sp. C2222]|uniref:Outer membrane protein beta-barrel domain-containing protein n=1 Tax=Marinomonas sargassi TaxID=2984494 RepID=A0ABT2YTW3_9GAMM|nr:hypothetical protein [Marinomonas sargassi]MCV2403205.1 hypothetical protein [Marinomonas sargassi]